MNYFSIFLIQLGIVAENNNFYTGAFVASREDLACDPTMPAGGLPHQ